MSNTDYDALRNRLRRPAVRVIANWPRFVHPYTAAEDAQWPVLDESEADHDTVEAWLRRRMAGLPGLQRIECALVAVELVLPVWEAWVHRHPALFEWRAVPRACWRQAAQFARDGGWRPTLEPARQQLATLDRRLAERERPLGVGPAPQAVLAALRHVFAGLDGEEAAGWQAVWHCVRAVVWYGMPVLGSHRATRRAEFLRDWWQRCCCRLPFDQPGSTELVR